MTNREVEDRMLSRRNIMILYCQDYSCAKVRWKGEKKKQVFILKDLFFSISQRSVAFIS